MLYRDPRTKQQMVDDHTAPLLAEADARRQLRDDVDPEAASPARQPSGGRLRHLLAAARHPGLQPRHAHPQAPRA